MGDAHRISIGGDLALTVVVALRESERLVEVVQDQAKPGVARWILSLLRRAHARLGMQQLVADQRVELSEARRS